MGIRGAAGRSKCDVFSFYADESGTFDLFDRNQPWVVFLAVGFNDDHWVQIDSGVRSLKLRFFPSWDVDAIEIHSADLRRANREQYPPNPFSTLPEETRARFGAELYALIRGLPVQWCASAIRKETAINRFGLRDSDELFKMAYMLLVERLHGWCAQENNVGRLFIDQQEHNLLGAVHALIEREHYDLRQRGSGWQDVSRIIERPYFHDSKRSSHTQLADILAYNVYKGLRYGNPPDDYYRWTMAKVRGNPRPDGSVYGLKVVT